MEKQEIICFILCYAGALLFCPLQAGIINKVKAFFAGRCGVSIFQLYFDLFKLLKKERVHSLTSNWILAISPLAQLGLTLAALALLPLGVKSSPLGFSGDVIIFFYLLGTARFLMVLAALDTGSSFEGMGASREVQFSALAEGTVFALLALLAIHSSSLETGKMLHDAGMNISAWHSAVVMVLAGLAFFVVLLCENCRVPFDDPETHLELTMIHEAMVLDYAGPDLAAIFYGASLKLWLFASFLTSLVLPGSCFSGISGIFCYFGAVAVTAVLIGMIESMMARSRFLKLPQLLTGATILVALALIIQIFFHGGVIK